MSKRSVSGMDMNNGQSESSYYSGGTVSGNGYNNSNGYNNGNSGSNYDGSNYSGSNSEIQMHPDVLGLYAFQGSENAYKAHVEELKKRHRGNSTILNSIALAQQHRVMNHQSNVRSHNGGSNVRSHGGGSNSGRTNYHHRLAQEYATVHKATGQRSNVVATSRCAGVDNAFTDPCWKGIIGPVLAPILANPVGCGTDALGAHQELVIRAAQMMATSGPLTPMKRRGLLVYHNAGSGKTVTAMGIALAFWNTTKKIFFVTTNDNISNNPSSEYAKNCLVFFPQAAKQVVFKGMDLPPLPWTNAEYKRTTAENKPSPMKVWCTTQGASVIEKRFKILSFWRFGGAGGFVEQMKEESGSVLIVDEAQNIFKPKNQKGRETEALARLASILPKEAYMRHSYSFLLTATPGSTASQVMNLISLVRPFGMPYITPQGFVSNPSLIRGLVSYADVRGDRSKYGSIVGGKPVNLYVPMDDGYYHAYINQLHTGNQVKELNTDPQKSKLFFQRDLQRSCIMTMTQVKSFYNDDALAKRTQVQVGRSTYVLSTKMDAAFKNINSISGCQYMYVSTPMTLKACIAALTKQGYVYADPNTKLTTPAKRFFPYHAGKITVGGDEISTTPQQLKSVLDTFKSAANQRGDLIKVFIGTRYEGLDMHYLQAVHIMSPLPTMEDDEQAIGRALRYCGHRGSANKVAVYRYFATPPKHQNTGNMTEAKQKKIERQKQVLAQLNSGGVNMHVYRDAERRGKPLEMFMGCVQAQSVECDSSSAKGGILENIQFTPVRCHARCPVRLGMDGELVVPKDKGSVSVRPSAPSIRPSAPSIRPSSIRPQSTSHPQSMFDRSLGRSGMTTAQLFNAMKPRVSMQTSLVPSRPVRPVRPVRPTDQTNGTMKTSSLFEAMKPRTTLTYPTTGLTWTEIERPHSYRRSQGGSRYHWN